MLIVLAWLLIPVSVSPVWAIRTVTNTDQYVATMAPLARNQAIVEHLAQKAINELFSTHTVQNKVTAALPLKAKPIVTPVVAQVHTYVYGLGLKVFESPKFRQLITLFNRLKPILTQGSNLGVMVVSKSQVSEFSGFFNHHIPTLSAFGWTSVLEAVVALGVFTIARLGLVVDAATSRRRLVVVPLAALTVAVLAIAYGHFSGKPEDLVLSSSQDTMGAVVNQSASFSQSACALFLTFNGLAPEVSLGGARGGPTFPAMFLGIVAGLLCATCRESPRSLRWLL